jgi:hypothetical protein
MSVPTLGLLTIGQSPRPDMTGTYSGLGAHILEAGALDGLSAAEVARDVAPTSEDVVAGRTVYVTRLRDGSEVKVLKGRVTEGLQQRIDEMGPRCDLIVVLCTGTFHGLSSPIPLLFPDVLLTERVRELGATERLHVVMPAPEQAEFFEAKWGPEVGHLSLDSASPYQPFDAAGLARHALSPGSAPQAVVLDCMGFGPEHRDSLEVALAAADHPEIPVILSQEVVRLAVARAMRR